MVTVRETVIIGSGPAGYTAAIYTARARLAPILLEGSTSGGGALMNTTAVENFPGFGAGIMGPALMHEMRAQASRFGAELVADDAVQADLCGEVKTVIDGSGKSYHARSVILAMGSRYRELGLINEQRLAGRGVSWCATCDGAFFIDRDVAVIGGGDSALEEALFLSRFARTVTVIHRRGALRASKVMQERVVANQKVSFVWNSEVTDIIGESRVTGLELRSTITGQVRTLEAAAVFVAIGHEPRSELVRGQLTCDDAGYVPVDYPSSHTSISGVFAAGDLVDSRYRQAITAAGTGCQAALDAERFLASLSSIVQVVAP